MLEYRLDRWHQSGHGRPHQTSGGDNFVTSDSDISETDAQRYPNHPIEFRRELAKRACEPCVSVARLPQEHGLNTNLLLKWRRAYQAAQYELATLLSVEVVHDERAIQNAAAMPVQSHSKAQPVAAEKTADNRVTMNQPVDAITATLPVQAVRRSFVGGESDEHYHHQAKPPAREAGCCSSVTLMHHKHPRRESPVSLPLQALA